MVDIFLREVGGNAIEIDMALSDISRRANVEVMSKTNGYVVSILFNKINNRLRVLGKGEEILPLGFKGNKVLIVRRSDGFEGGSNGRFVGREVEKKFRFGEGKERKEFELLENLFFPFLSFLDKIIRERRGRRSRKKRVRS